MNPVSVEFGAVEVLDVEGRPHRLRETWAGQPCVLMFVRHFGCMLCREQVVRLRPRLREIRDAGGSLVVVGTGGPSFARAFQKELGIPEVEVYSDPKRRGYELAGFRRGLWTLLHPRAVGHYLRAFLSGHRYKGMQGDALQQGGVLVVALDGTLVYRFASRVAGDHPQADRIVAAVRAAARREPLVSGPGVEGGADPAR